MCTEASPSKATPERPAETSSAPPSWTARYGELHRLIRITQFPAGIMAPKKVRIYSRRDHYVLQWWDPREKATLSHRVEGDLVTAITQARAFDERLLMTRSSGQPRKLRMSHSDLVARFQADLMRRADAGEIEPATVHRYGAALQHYLAFCEQSSTARVFPNATAVNRDFRLAFTTFLSTRAVSGNGRPASPPRPMKGQAFVLDAVRALFEWAADPERGGLLSDSFRNPFCHARATRSLLQGDPLAEPDITLFMALDLIAACDAWQLRLFGPMLLFGLRAAEPCFLFVDYVKDNWLQVPCNPELDVKTKGKRSKRFPLPEELQALWGLLISERTTGLLYLRRPVAEGREKPFLLGRSLSELVEEYRRRCARSRDITALERQRLRDGVLHDAGALTYNHIVGEFSKLARRLGWSAAATVKDLRHLFATTMNNAAMPEGFQRYLMGQAPGRAAIVAYTHLHELKRHYAEALHKEWMSLITAINRRVADLIVLGG